MIQESCGILIQARTGSSRLPGKVLEDLCGFPVLEWVIHRCALSQRVRKIVVVTSELQRDDPVAGLAARTGVLVFRGSEQDVLKRYADAADEFGLSSVIRVTADCPFVDPDVIDQVVDAYEQQPADHVYASGYPEGVGSIELVQTSVLKRILELTCPRDTHYREHVTTYLATNPEAFDIKVVTGRISWPIPHTRFSVDTPDDLLRARRIAASFRPSREFRTLDLLAWSIEHDPINVSSFEG